MKNSVKKIVLTFLILGVISCQKEDDTIFEENLQLENKITEADLEKSGPGNIRVICSIEGIPDGYEIVEYLTLGRCPNYNLFLGSYNAAIVKRNIPTPNNTPSISSAGAGCNDNYCIWIVGSNFESGAYVDIRTTTGSSIIGTYRGADRTLTTNSQGQQVITLRLRSAFERNQFASRGLRIWVVNPIARKWADGRTVKRPGNVDPIDPPCNPNCP